MSSSITSAARKPVRDMRRHSPWSMFFREFVKHPVMVGAVAPSSQATINRVLAPVDWASTKLIVEYGPGVGTFCGPVLDRLGPDAKLISIDTNTDFVAHLRDTIRDPRFSVVNGSAADVGSIVADHGYDSADHVLSGLPFSTLPPGVADEIVAATYDVIKSGGMFLVYQYNPVVRRYLATKFDRIDHAMEWRNLPPQQIWWAHRD
jgi:phospholipid N-methyltransferase